MLCSKREGEKHFHLSLSLEEMLLSLFSYTICKCSASYCFQSINYLVEIQQIKLA